MSKRGRLLMWSSVLLFSLVIGITGFFGRSSALAQPAVVSGEDSVLFRALQEFRRRPVLFDFAPGDRLAAYSEECRQATGISIPDFSCGAGVEVPGQGTQPGGAPCDHPNVLNGRCDPGSRFQVLPGRSADAVAVAHCRKDGLSVGDSLYNDIAVIQYNKANGALCFYQALGYGDGALPGDNIPSPGKGDGAPWSSGQARWLSPAATHGIGCTACHDSGGFLRSNYIAQLRTPPNAMPNQADGYDNAASPLRYVGQDYASDRSWSIVTGNDPSDGGASCAACHRLAVNNVGGRGDRGTALDFALRATAATQASKNPHGPGSPIWMRPGQIVYQAAAEATAKRFHDCAAGFKASGFVTAPPGCTLTPLGLPWGAPGPTSSSSDTVGSAAAVIDYYLNP